MTISSQIRKAGPYIGNGSASAFPFAFKVFTASDLYVVKTNTTLGADSVLTLGADYTVSLNADQNANPGGTITLTAGALASGYNVTITSSLQYLQPTDLTNQGGFYPSVITNALDRLTIFCQQLYDAVSRSLKVSVSTPAGVSTTLPPPAANKLIGWNATADNLQNMDATSLATVVAFGTANADKFSGDGVTTQFALSANPGALNNLDVAVGGVSQRPGIDYTWTAGTTLTFTSAPPSGTNNVLVRYMQGLPQGYTTSDMVQFTPSGPGAVPTSAQAKLREHQSVADFGIVSNGTTDQTSALVTLMGALSAAGFRGWLRIPYNTKFTTATVYAAVPTGVILDDESSINWGQPPGYKNKFRIMYSGDVTADDTQHIIASPHHPALQLLNTGTSGSASGASRYASILHGVGIDYAGDSLLGWLMQFSKDPSQNAWMWSLRMETPYLVAMGNPKPWVTTTVYAAGSYCISDGGKVYKTTAGGTSGATAPTGTGASISDGGVTWSYVQGSLALDSTRFTFDENANLKLYNQNAGGVQQFWMSGDARSHYFEVNGTTNDVLWRDNSRGRDIIRVSDGAGTQLSGIRSFPWSTISNNSATPTIASSYHYMNNSSATTLTNLVLPGTQAQGYVCMLFANSNTTIQHGGNFILKGAVNVTPTSGQMMEFIRYSSHSGAWIEKSRNF